jgi:hypothetical protein
MNKQRNKQILDYIPSDLLVLNEHIGYGLRISPYDTTCWNKYDDDIGIYSHSIVTLPDDYTKGKLNDKKI